MKELLVMLEKAPGKINVDKLRAILLLEANFNTLYKIVFNLWLILELKENNSVLKEIIGDR